MALISKDAFPVSQFIKNNRAKPCRMKCGECKKPWAETGTEAVSMYFKTPTSTAYICSGCADILENNEEAKGQGTEPS